MQLPAVFPCLRRERLAHVPEIGLIPGVLPLHPCLGAGARHILQLAAVPQHEKEVAESCVDVNVLGILGRPRQVNAHVAGDTAQTARGVARIHLDGRLRSHHDIPAEGLQHHIPWLGDL